MTTHATDLLHQAAGRPAPFDCTGAPIPPRAVSGRCCMCGAEAPARWAYGQVLSESFWPLRNAGVLFGHAPEGADRAFCAACTWAARTLALRCAAWIARPSGLWWVPQRGLMDVLLDPPTPPFVAGYPRYGIAHGGEVHAHRCAWGGVAPPDVLPRLQAKHVAIYATVATSRDAYPLQVDDGARVLVDRPRWARARADLDPLARELRAAGIGPSAIRAGFASLRPPARTPLGLLARWGALAGAWRAEARAPWWGLITSLLPIPDAEPVAPSPLPVPATPLGPRQLTMF